MKKKITKLEDLKEIKDAYDYLKVDRKKATPDFKYFPAKHRKAMIAMCDLVLIVEAANKLANGGKTWKVDYDNPDQYKYEIWWDKRRGSSGFRFGDYANWISDSDSGSRLCFISSEVAEYVGKTFEKVWNDFLL